VTEEKRSRFPAELRDGLWHTTSPNRFESIVKTGSILPEPPIPENERWKTSQGPEYHPYVRTLGGVSLFDFQGFDPEAYGQSHPMSSWTEFVPCPPSSEVAVWLEIDRLKISRSFIDRDALVARWKEESAYTHTIMPRIEAAHIGPLPIAAVARVLRFDAKTGTFEEIQLAAGQHA